MNLEVAHGESSYFLAIVPSSAQALPLALSSTNAFNLFVMYKKHKLSQRKNKNMIRKWAVITSSLIIWMAIDFLL